MRLRRGRLPRVVQTEVSRFWRVGQNSNAEERREFAHAANRGDGGAGQSFRRRPVAIDPDRLKPERGASPGIPAVGRDEADACRRHPEPIHGELVDRGVGFEDAHGLDGERRLEQAGDAGRVDRGGEHGGRSVRKRGRPFPGGAQPGQGGLYVGIGVEGQILLQQRLAEGGGGEVVRGQRVIEALAGHLPEVRVPAHERSQPRVLELLPAPQFGERRPAFAQARRVALRGGRDVEERAVGVEHDGLDVE